MAAHILDPCFATLRQEHPGILVRLIPDPRELSLSMRGAEKSVRLTQPNQHDLVVRRIGSVAFGLYASLAYLRDPVDLDFEAGCHDQHLIAQLDDIQDALQFVWLSEATVEAQIAFQISSHEAAVSAALHRGELACLARFRANREEGLVRLTSPLAAPTTGIWLVVNKDHRETTRIRAVMSDISDHVRSIRRV